MRRDNFDGSPMARLYDVSIPSFRDTSVSCPVNDMNDTIGDWPFPGLDGSNVGEETAE